VAKGLSVKYIEETGGFDKPTLTCLAIGPDYSSVIDPITKHLKLL
jgi:peptidyl-tRNA hydrolase